MSIDRWLLPPRRPGRRPKTSQAVPHRQLNQWPPASIFETFLYRSRDLSGVRVKESRMAADGTHALSIDEGAARGPAEAFIDDHEFCHLHPLPHGSIHLTLPDVVRPDLLRLGWGELHLLARSGFLPQTLVLIYAPRDDREIEVVARLVKASYDFARGLFESE